MKHKHVEKIDLKMRPLVLSQFHQSASTQISLSGLVEDEGREGGGQERKREGEKREKKRMVFWRNVCSKRKEGAKEKKIKKVKEFFIYFLI